MKGVRSKNGEETIWYYLSLGRAMKREAQTASDGRSAGLSYVHKAYLFICREVIVVGYGFLEAVCQLVIRKALLVRGNIVVRSTM
jgi:hypothetical protein